MSEIKKITDAQQIQQITANLFCKKPIKIQEAGGEHPVRVLSFSAGVLLLEHDRPEAPARGLIVSHNDYWMLLECQVLGPAPEGGEQVRPVRLHIKRAVRKEPRIDLSGVENVPLLLNMVPIKNFPDMLSAENKTRDALLKLYEQGLGSRYSRVAIVLLKSMRLDQRMRAIVKWKRPIFAPAVGSPAKFDSAHHVPYEDYEKIRSYDNLPATLVGEACYPLAYRDTIYWGYVQILADRALKAEDFEAARATARDLEREFEGHGYLPRAEAKCAVVDISLHGVGFVLPAKANLSRHFMPGEEVVFDLKFPGHESTSFTGNIKNTRIVKQSYRIGLEFTDLREEQHGWLEEYIQAFANRS